MIARFSATLFGVAMTALVSLYLAWLAVTLSDVHGTVRVGYGLVAFALVAVAVACCYVVIGEDRTGPDRTGPAPGPAPRDRPPR